ncbi:hypothetical protein [Frankia sp. Cr1]|uniref:hypothetical protein n=1 Tax=Frankia sp. Cr1 TaxID=3073931 RepID=UPI002AD35088|nr:hypothetical protein [Frankia sp. Cr1]
MTALYAEGEENTEREQYTPEEAVRHAEIIVKVERRAAAERQGTRTDLQPSAKFAEGSPASLPPHERQSRARTAKAVGMSHRTLTKATKVVKTAEDETAPRPVREAAREAAAEMNRSGKVDPARPGVDDGTIEHPYGLVWRVA